MPEYWPLIALAIGAVVVAVCTVLVTRRARRTLKSVQDTAPTQPLAEDGSTEPATGVSAQATTPVPTAGTAARTELAEAADEVSFDKVALEELLGILKGHGGGPRTHTLGRDGRYNHKSGVRFTVAYLNDLCVIVRLAKTSDRHVWRVVVHMNNTEILSILFNQYELRLLPGATGRPGPILAQQARDVSTKDMQSLTGTKLTDLAAELRVVYRVGDI